ncbi:hypothetical protein Dimus_004066, partial [Dionaea muscipula]
AVLLVYIASYHGLVEKMHVICLSMCEALARSCSLPMLSVILASRESAIASSSSLMMRDCLLFFVLLDAEPCICHLASVRRGEEDEGDATNSSRG